MSDPIHPLVLIAFALTLATLWVASHAAWRAARTGELPWSRVRRARRFALVLFAAALSMALAHRAATRDWVHFHWSLVYPLLGLALVSGVFLSSMWARDRDHERQQTGRTRDVSRSGWWFPVAAVALGLASIALQLALPGRVPTALVHDGTVLVLVGIAAYGLGLGPLPPVLEVVSPQGELRGMGYLTPDLSLSLDVLTLAAKLTVVYVALALASRLMPRATSMRSTLLLAPVLTTCVLFATRPDPEFIWDSDPGAIRAFGPTLAAGVAALVALALVWAFDRRAARLGGAGAGTARSSRPEGHCAPNSAH